MTNSSFPRDVEDVVFTLCEDLATPRSLTVFLMVKHGEWDQLVNLSVDPAHFLDRGYHQAVAKLGFRLPDGFRGSDHYWRDAVATSFLRKCEGLPTSFDRKAAAYESFYKCEKECFRANERLSPFLHGAYAPGEEAIFSFLLNARKMIRSILGPCPADVIGRFGPGATYGDKGKLSTVPDKMSSRPTLTSSAMGFLFPWSSTAWASACASSGRAPLFIRGNRFTAVPKDARKFRGIAIEPSINLFYQLGFGSALRSRLRDSGINLNDGQVIHKQVACEASRSGAFSTIDLSNASDTVCINLVKLLLPSSWFKALNDLRSPTTNVEGKVVVLEKFSSMGNGFTFELETLIFLGLCSAAMISCGIQPLPGENLWVFGDDIIVPADCSGVLKSALSFCGMTVNQEKSFVNGPFKESCGGDYFDGTDVRPFFLKEFPYEPQHYMAMANGIRGLAFAAGRDVSRFSDLRRTWFRILDFLPSAIKRLRGPQDLGDIVIHDDEENHDTRYRYGIRQYRTYRPIRFRTVSWKYFDPDVILATAVYGVGHGRDGVSPRDNVLGHGIAWVPKVTSA